MEIKQKDDGKNGMFYVEQDGKVLAQMTYVWTGAERIIIDHTEVDDALRGQSAGKQLVAKAVEFAREKSLKIIPLCPFAKSVFDKVAEYRDVL
ncbi:MAG TPA: GNAT family N-acetyltransferase [Saprospiraceae bacterium]|nr:GNAT family N-acetyltransferase [Saprospiraceae bacterium]HMU05348.1 GNAT family N-acetyltransferase [Saprospiraceae bacterium]